MNDEMTKMTTLVMYNRHRLILNLLPFYSVPFSYYYVVVVV